MLQLLARARRSGSIYNELLAREVVRKNRYMREANASRREADSYMKSAAHYKKQVERLKEKLREQDCELEEAAADKKDLKKKLAKWTLFWGWVKAWGSACTVGWLRSLWQQGPPKARDRGCSHRAEASRQGTDREPDSLGKNARADP